MKDQIGQVAGKIWRTLETKGEVSLAQLPKILKEKDATAYQGLGWLAREGKVNYRTEGTRTFVSVVK
ncbi:hypothetical protein C3F09_03000 [candidate division GN15 bacterium]|uniref:Winged helix-turn-helix domain-containing protein n=1 Tax=candidate division GN15 bacterium TaxID=2072418 RepID=A0A855X399_9BACT|nr:MAG: hypothetical protein C3F09_03000 [candidate division GN15 bacterium]